MKNKYKLIYIEWCDATSNEDSWKTPKDSIEWANNENWVVKMCGWILKETKEYILICNKLAPENNDSEEQVGSLFKIPKTWIRKRKVLKI